MSLPYRLSLFFFLPELSGQIHQLEEWVKGHHDLNIPPVLSETYKNYRKAAISRK